MKELKMVIPVVCVHYTSENLIEAISEVQTHLSKIGLEAVMEMDSSGELALYYGTPARMENSSEDWRSTRSRVFLEPSEGYILMYWDIVECVDKKEFFERFPEEKNNKKKGKK